MKSSNPRGQIIVVGTSEYGGLRNSIVSALSSLGRNVEAVDVPVWRPARFESFAIRAPRLAFGYRRRLLRDIDRFVSGGVIDLVLVVKGSYLDAHTIDQFRSRLSAPVVCWNPDSPFDKAISNRGGGIPAAIGAYDGYVTWADDVAERLASRNSHVIVIPFAWDPMLHRPTAGSGVAEGRIVLVGTGSRYRSELVREIVHLRPVVFGNRWPSIDGVEFHSPIFGTQMSAVVGEAKWNLNFLHPQNALSHNMRTFEIPGSGGNQVADRTKDHERFLGSDSRTLLFDSHAELESILRSDPVELTQRRPDLLAMHTYIERVSLLLREPW